MARWVSAEYEDSFAEDEGNEETEQEDDDEAWLTNLSRLKSSEASPGKSSTFLHCVSNIEIPEQYLPVVANINKITSVEDFLKPVPVIRQISLAKFAKTKPGYFIVL